MNNCCENGRCANCNNVIKEGYTVYFVKPVVSKYDQPTCCNECAQELKQKYIDYFQNKIDMIQNQKIDVCKWK